MKYEVIHYVHNGRDIYREWLDGLMDKRGQAVIIKRVTRLMDGNFGDNHYCRDGIWELVIDYGAGYRVYYSIVGNMLVLLLCAGSKRTQDSDITRAIKYLKEFKEGR